MSPSRCRTLPLRAAVYRDTLGAAVSPPQPLPEHGVTVVFVDLGNTKIELLEPLGRGLADRRLPGRRSRPAAFTISATRSTTSWRRATGCGRRAPACSATATPKIGAHGKPVLFLHPKDFCGTLIELEQV